MEVKRYGPKSHFFYDDERIQWSWFRGCSYKFVERENCVWIQCDAPGKGRIWMAFGYEVIPEILKDYLMEMDICPHCQSPKFKAYDYHESCESWVNVQPSWEEHLILKWKRGERRARSFLR